MKTNIAIIDLGSNLTKLVITSGELPLQVIHRSVYNTKTLKSAPKGFFDSQSIAQIESDIQSILDVANKYDCSTYLGIATSAFRTRKNGLQVIRDLNQKFNLQINIISGEREAQLIYKGAIASTSVDRFPVMIMDIGGGSTELIIADASNILWKHSFNFGSTALTSGLSLSDPLSPNDIEDLNNRLEQHFADLPQIIQAHAPLAFIGTTGAFESFAQIIESSHNSHESVASNYRFEPKKLHKVLDQILKSSLQERLDTKGLNPLRVPTVHIAALIFKYVLDLYSFDEYILSLGDVKEGLAKEHMESQL
ncbi:hypothetical protein KFE94_04570 [bacterium SCSIO 12643]|nr:hypothetical protein KFE94_04570 [bacterium SCSIO 12643]